MIELTLPAGSMQAALAAFDGGADAVYVGLRSYSARQAATNFSLEQIAQLATFCRANGKRFYVTLNTLLDDQAIRAIVPTLRQLELIGCDGVIVQDLGLAHLIRRAFPSLALHASTQLAAHTAGAVRQLATMGFERVVLARELTIEEIEAIRHSCPDIELKVFIHGALCYSVSGLCMASYQVTGRSANEGACAQICRSYFTVESDLSLPSALSPPGRNADTAWFFSMSDLAAGTAIRRLREIGIDSVKVEGRMKSPLYSRAAARYFRALLDGDDQEASLADELAIAFARRQSGGWLTGYGRVRQDFSIRTKPTLGSTSYPEHRGVLAATVVGLDSQGVWIRSSRSLGLRDGLLYFTPSTTEPIEAVRFGITALYDQGRRRITSVDEGSVALLALPEKKRWPQVGHQLFMVSSHRQNIGLYSEAIEPYKRPITITATIEDEAITLSGWKVAVRYELKASPAKSEQDIEATLTAVLGRSASSSFRLKDLVIDNRSSLATGSLFYPISRLNEMRRAFYDALEEHYSRSLELPYPQGEEPPARPWQQLPPRSALVTDLGLPYLDLTSLLYAYKGGKPLSSHLFEIGGWYYLPLSPVMFTQEQFFEELEAVVEALTHQKIIDRVRFGINNVGQIPFFVETQLACWADVYLYLSNGESANAILDAALNLIGGYLWMERASFDAERWPVTPTVVDKDFRASAFISRSCFRRDSLLLSCEGCPHRGRWIVRSDSVDYTVIVEDCITHTIALR